MATALGEVSAVYSLLQAARCLLEHIRSLRSNDSLRLRLQTLTENLIGKLEGARTASPSACDITRQELESVQQSVQSVTRCTEHGFCSCVLSCICATFQHSKLKDAERKLENLQTQVVVVDNIFQCASRIYNEAMDLPSSLIGLDRAVAIMNFMKASEMQAFRVIVIHGPGGVGKTTLLNYVWKEVLSEASLIARAYVHIGDIATSDAICKVQAKIFKQLGNHGETDFPSHELGGGGLNNLFRKLKDERKQLFLALDNVVKVEDLDMLLPFGLGIDNLHVSSCIALTCRDYSVVKALLSKCRLQTHNQKQVFRLQPRLLDIEESKKLFAESANMQHSEPQHEELLNAIVPTCGGLPLALCVLGRIFVDEGSREKLEWRLLKRDMDKLDLHNQGTSPVTKSVKLSYDRLGASRQEAFLDIVSTFYGWPWETVERIVGVDVMRDLKYSSLISPLDSIDKCNQSAFKYGYDFDYCYGGAFDDKRVIMHDLTLRVGESILSDENRKFFLYKNEFHGNFKFSQVRNLYLSLTDFTTGELENLLCKARYMQMLVIFGHKELKLFGTLGKNFKPEGISYLMISDCMSSKSIISQVLAPAEGPSSYNTEECSLMTNRRTLEEPSTSAATPQLVLSPPVSTDTIREVTLDMCEDLIQLPETGYLRLLERLRICNCAKFEGFSPTSVAGWENLRDLVLYACDRITTIPIQLGQLPNLRAVIVSLCNGLQHFPSLTHTNGPSCLIIRDCSSLETLGPICCPIKKLEVEGVPIQLLEVTDYIGSLESLEIIECHKLTDLLPSIKNAEDLPSLVHSNVKGCPLLENRPIGIEKFSRKASTSPVLVRSSSASFGKAASFRKKEH